MGDRGAILEMVLEIHDNATDTVRTFKANLRNLDDGMDRTSRSSGGLANKMGALKLAMLGAAAGGAVALGAFSVSAINSASNLAESESKVSVVFAEQAEEIKAWAADSAKAFGQSKQQALEAAGTYGNLFQAFGVGRKESAEMSTSLVELAADLASFNNTSVDEALIALRSGLSGETEPLKRFGVAINDVRLREEALKLGLIATTKDALTPGIKAQAAYALVMHDTMLAQGDFGRTSDGLANKQRILSATWENAKAQLGVALLPVMLLLVGVLADHVVPAIAAAATHFGNFIETIRAGLSGDVGRAAEAFNKLPAPLQALALWLAENKEEIIAVALVVKQLAQDALKGLILIVKDATKFFSEHREMLIVVGIAIAALLVWLYAIPVAIIAITVGIGLLRTHWDDIMAYFREEFPALFFIAKFYFELIKNQIVTAIGVIREVISLALALIRGDWGEAWQSLKDLGGVLFDGFVTDISLKLAMLRDVFAFAFGAMAGIVADKFGFIGEWVDNVREKFGDLRDWIWQVIDAIKSIPTPGDVIGGIANLVGRADGGALQDGWTMVGERGIELAHKHGGAVDIYSNSDTRRMLAAGPAPAQTLTQHIYVDRVIVQGDPRETFAALGVSL